MPERSRSLTAILGATLLLYPLLVYAGLQHAGPRLVAGLVLAVVLLRVLASDSLALAGNQTLWLLLAAAATTVTTLVTGSAISLKCYPVAVNLILLAVFALSLRRPPTVIERIARLRDPDLPPSGIRYTRVVTWVWCGFFVANASLAGLTALSSDRAWALYNGFIAYLLMGTLFAVEFLVRQRQTRG